MERKDSITVSEGNAFYEIDVSCVRRKQEDSRKKRQEQHRSSFRIYQDNGQGEGTE